MNAEYTVHSGHITEDIENSDFFSSLIPTLSTWFRKIYEKSGMVEEVVNLEVARRISDFLNTGVEQNYVHKFTNDRQVVEALKKNVQVFSLFKTHKQQQEIASLLTKKGKVVPYEDFEKQALKISLDYNKNWLKTEYNTAVEQARLVSYWQKIQEEKGTYPYLQYITRDDSAVRDEHQKWHNKILPVNHPWWNTHYPVNGFNCRCTVKQLTEGDAKRLGISKEKREETYHSEFNFNAGKTQEIFGEYHSYFKDIPDETAALLREYAEHTSMTEKKW